MLAHEEIFSKWEKKIPATKLINRDHFILNQCTRRKVAHLGSCDAPMTEDKAARGELLHQKLQAVATELRGFDIDRKSIDLLRNSYGIKNIEYFDFSSGEWCFDGKFDIVLCADIIEHVSNVDGLLSSCNKMLDHNGTIIMSTINALSFKQALRHLIGREPVHPDHIAYYSYSTLGSLFCRYGFAISNLFYFSYKEQTGLARIVFGVVNNIFPQTADGILVIGTKAHDHR